MNSDSVELIYGEGCLVRRGGVNQHYILLRYKNVVTVKGGETIFGAELPHPTRQGVV